METKPNWDTLTAEQKTKAIDVLATHWGYQAETQEGWDSNTGNPNMVANEETKEDFVERRIKEMPVETTLTLLRQKKEEELKAQVDIDDLL